MNIKKEYNIGDVVYPVVLEDLRYMKKYLNGQLI